MELIGPFDGRFAHPFNLIVSGPSQSGSVLVFIIVKYSDFFVFVY
jgi:hypothetical protein